MRPVLLRSLAAAMAAAFLCITAPAVQAYDYPKPQLYAVYFWAEWCSNCKILTPKLEAVQAMPEISKAPVLFVKFDLTDKPHIHQTMMLASALGLDGYMKQQGSATGYLAVLSSEKKEITRFDRAASEKEIADGILKNLPHEK